MSSSITNTRLFSQRELIIKGTHRGLWYQDGVLTQVLGAGRYVLPRRFGFGRRAYARGDPDASHPFERGRRAAASGGEAEALRDILADVHASAAGYGVEILRADVKDLMFPGNLQEIMNRVLAAERLSQAQLVEARTQAEKARIDAEARAETLQTLRDLAQVANARIYIGFPKHVDTSEPDGQ